MSDSCGRTDRPSRRRALCLTMIFGVTGPYWLQQERSCALTALWFLVEFLRALGLLASLSGVVAGAYLAGAATLVTLTLTVSGTGATPESETRPERSS